MTINKDKANVTSKNTYQPTYKINVLGFQDGELLADYRNIKGINAPCGKPVFTNIFNSYDEDKLISYSEEFLDFMDIVFATTMDYIEDYLDEIVILFISSKIEDIDFGVHVFWDDNGNLDFDFIDFDEDEEDCSNCPDGYDFVFDDEDEFDE